MRTINMIVTYLVVVLSFNHYCLFSTQTQNFPKPLFNFHAMKYNHLIAVAEHILPHSICAIHLLYPGKISV